MQNKMHTTWFTMFILIASLLSSVASSASLSLTIAPSGQIVVEVSNCGSTPEYKSFTKQVSCDLSGICFEHQCCTISRIANYTLIFEQIRACYQLSSLALVSKEPVQHINATINSLYRPPIA